MIWVSVGFILMISSGIWKTVMDFSSEGKYTGWWDKQSSWKNKDRYKPRWLFRTALVWVTDGWHLSQFIFLNTLMASIIALCQYFYVWLGVLVAFTGMKLFSELYRQVKKK